MSRLSLLFVTLVTAFNDDERIKFAAMRKQVRRQSDAGSHVLVCGTNGDFSSLLSAEKVHLSAAVLEAANGKRKVFVNVGALLTFETIKVAQDIDALGVDGLAVITPYFISCTQEGLYRHFCSMADAVTAPLYLYDIPARAQNHIEPETAERLANHGNIAGIKDSGGTQDTLDDYLKLSVARNDFDVFSGADSMVHYALSSGALECISGLANIDPLTLTEICTKHDVGDARGAEQAQARFAGLWSDLYALGYPPAITNRALYLMDSSVGASRQPALLPDQMLDMKITNC